MMKSDAWPEFIKATLMWFIPTAMTMIAFFKIAKEYFVSKVDIAKQNSLGGETGKKLLKEVQDLKSENDDLKKKAVELKELVLENKQDIKELTKAMETLRQMHADDMRLQMEALLRGTKPI